MTLAELEIALQKSWSRETSSLPEHWSPENPAVGQCAISSLIVNDYLGGKIVWAEVTMPDRQTSSHYFNLIDGQEIDLTRSQFPAGSIIPAGVDKQKGFASTRDYMLSSDNTTRRYRMLKEKVKKYFSADTDQ